MKILQQAVKVKRHSRVNVYFDKPCTIYLMTEVNFKRYKEGASFRRLGGEFKESPAEFVAPYDGTWHAVIERGSHFNPINVTGRVEVLPPLMKEVPYLYEDDISASDSESSDESEEIATSAAEASDSEEDNSSMEVDQDQEEEKEKD